MAKKLHDLLSKNQHKFGAQNVNSIRKIQGRTSKSSVDLEELEIRVRSTLIALNRKCPVSVLEEEYRKCFGEKLPFREFGSSNSVELLKKIPGACEFCGESSGDPLVIGKSSEKSQHISNLNKKNKSKPKQLPIQSVPQKDVFVPFTIQDEIRRILYTRRNIRKTDFIKLLEERFDLNFFNLQVSVDILIRSLPHILINNGVFVKSAYNIQEDEIEMPEVLNMKGAHISPSFRLGKYESVVSENLCALLGDRKQMYVTEIPRFYLQKFGKELQWRKYGFDDLWRFLLLLPGDFRMFKSESGYVVTESVVPGTEDIREFHEQDLCGNSVYEEVLEKIRQLILHVNTGLNSKHLRSSYETLYFEKLIIKKNFNEFLRELHNLLIFEVKEIGTSCVLFPCNVYDILRLKEKKTEKVQQLRPSIDVLKPGDSLKCVKFPKVINANNQQFCAAFVSFVQSPDDFSIRIAGIGENHQMELDDAFERLSVDMNEDFWHWSEEYDIPLSDLKVKMVCAACVEGTWQRAVILDVLNKSRILVKSVDYGKCHKVEMSSLKYLPRRFAEIPMLAYPAKLFNIQPMGREWNLDTILKFRRLTIGNNSVPIPLSVLIIHRSEEGVMQVVLTEESVNKVTHIGDELVDCGYALFRFEEEPFGAMYC